MNEAEDSQALMQLSVGETEAVEVVISAAEEDAVVGDDAMEVTEESDA